MNEKVSHGPLRVLITGTRGFVGSETARRIADDLPSSYKDCIIPYDLMDGFDIRDAVQFERVIEQQKPDRILHLAAIARFSEADANPRLAHETNVIGTRNVAMVAGKHHIPIVYASTGSVYMPIEQEPPITEEFAVRGNSVYGVTKALGEKYIEEYSSAYIILRYAHLYGKEKRHHGLIGGFISRIERGLAPVLYGGQQSNDFTYIDDVARANHLALTAPWDSWNQAYNIGTGQELSAEEAGQIICRVTGYTGETELKKGRTVDPQRFVYDTSKAERMLKFKAQYDFEAGLKEMFTA